MVQLRDKSRFVSPIKCIGKVVPLLFTVALPLVAQVEQYSAVRDFYDHSSQLYEQAFDLTVSMENADNVLTDEVKAEYEEIFQYCADALYEMTNGVHYLGNVRIFTGGIHQDRSDIHWGEEQIAPNANAGGFRHLGHNIYITDHWTSDVQSWDLPNETTAGKQKIGYTIAHELGHYIYSLYDEYWLESGDVEVEPSIMSKQFNAISGNSEWLNFSTIDNFYEGNYLGIQNEQGRRWAMDAWTFLTTENVIYSYPKGRPPRDFYPLLNSVKPDGTFIPWISIELPNDEAHKHLDVEWMSPEINVDFILDVSGSMSGSRIESLKSQTNVLLESMEEYKELSYLNMNVGITTFSSSAQNVVSLTPFTSDGLITYQAAIAGLRASGSTALFDGALKGLDNLKRSGENEVRIGMLLSDGLINSGAVRDVNAVINAYNNAGAILHTIAYGSNHSDANLEQLALGTGGIYGSNVSDTELRKIWMKEIIAASDGQSAKSNYFTPDSTFSVEIDPTIRSVITEVSYVAQSESEERYFTISDNAGHPVNTRIKYLSFDDSYPRSEIAQIVVDSTAIAESESGTWHIECRTSTMDTLQVSTVIFGVKEGTFAVYPSIKSGDNISSREPLTIEAIVTKGSERIGGANLIATLITPSGIIDTIYLLDNGLGDDGLADDGIYVATYRPLSDTGFCELNFQVRNDSGSAFRAVEGTIYEGITPETTPVGFNFIRESSVRFSLYDSVTVVDSIVDFDSDVFWSFFNSTTGTLSSSVISSNGSASLQVVGNGWQSLISDSIETSQLRVHSDTVAFDIYVGSRQTSPWWRGSVQFSVHCPSANLHQVWVGSQQLINLPLDNFSTVSFTLSQKIMEIIAEEHDDFQFIISLNTPESTGEYYLDNLRFEK